jgi:hypothetical protein
VRSSLVVTVAIQAAPPDKLLHLPRCGGKSSAMFSSKLDRLSGKTAKSRESEVFTGARRDRSEVDLPGLEPQMDTDSHRYDRVRVYLRPSAFICG